MFRGIFKFNITYSQRYIYIYLENFIKIYNKYITKDINKQYLKKFKILRNTYRYAMQKHKYKVNFKKIDFFFNS